MNAVLNNGLIKSVSYTVAAANHLQDGWCAKLMKAGLRMTYSNGPFGRSIWVAKQDEHHVLFTQAGQVAFRNTLEPATEGQVKILEKLASHGLLTIQ